MTCSKMERALLAILLVLGMAWTSAAQIPLIVPSPPIYPTCGAGEALTFDGTTLTCIPTGGGGGLPTGLIAMIITGTCPSGFTEVATLDAKSLRGTLAAHADVGGAMGNDSVTPIFTGLPLSAHAHELPFYKVASSTGAVRMIPQMVFGSGTSRAAQSTSTSAPNTTSAPVALSQAVSAGTPAGTISAVPTIPASIKVIFCQKS